MGPIQGAPRGCGTETVLSSTTQAGFDAIADNLKPETSNTYEVGYRFQGSRFQGVLAAYYGGRDDAFWTRPETWPGRGV